MPQRSPFESVQNVSSWCAPVWAVNFLAALIGCVQVRQTKFCGMNPTQLVIEDHNK